MMLYGKKRNLSDLEKGRLILDFMKKKNDPFTNRHFYKHFFNEHDKAENISVLENVTSKIGEVISEQDGFFQNNQIEKVDSHENL